MKIEIGNNFSSTYYDSWWHENVFQIKRLGVLHSGFENMPRPEINETKADRKQSESIQTDRNRINPNQTRITLGNPNLPGTNPNWLEPTKTDDIVDQNQPNWSELTLTNPNQLEPTQSDSNRSKQIGNYPHQIDSK